MSRQSDVPLLAVAADLARLVGERHDETAAPSSVLALPSIPLDSATQICARAHAAFSGEPTLLELAGPLYVVGDLHGHFLELLRILRVFGLPPAARYLLLGDTVDRGEFSVHTALCLFALKALHPASLFVVRGNHECEEICRTHGLLAEVVDVYGGDALFGAMVRAFDALPLAARVNGDVLCVHGGVAPELRTLAQIAQIARPLRTAESAAADGLLWSDPRDGATTRRAPPGRGCDFGEELLAAFLARNALRLLVRAHEAIRGGVEYRMGGRLATVFSVSNYCDRGAGMAGVLELPRDGAEKAHRLGALPWVLRKAVAPPPAERKLALSTVPPRKSASQPPIVMHQFMRKPGRGKGAAV
jgi:diadenosine tetraphosphatase ApaH/serine/threonine PP2A family protein phosphatase